jgi:cell division protein FtsB
VVEVGRIRDYGPIEGIWLRSILLVARLYFQFILWYGRYSTNSLRENVEMSDRRSRGQLSRQ